MWCDWIEHDQGGMDGWISKQEQVSGGSMHGAWYANIFGAPFFNLISLQLQLYEQIV